MCCRTQLAPMRQVGQVGAMRTTSVGSRDAELNTLRSCWMLFTCGGAAAAFAPLPPWLAHAHEAFWIGRPDAHGLLYVQVNQIAGGDHETLEHFVDALSQRLSRLMWEGPDSDLQLTQNAQPAIMAYSIALIRTLEREAGLDVAHEAT